MPQTSNSAPSVGPQGETAIIDSPSLPLSAEREPCMPSTRTIQSGVTAVIAQIRQAWPLIVALTGLWSYLYLILWTDLFSLRGSFNFDLLNIVSPWTVSTIGNGLGLLLCWRLARTQGPWLTSTHAAAGEAVLMMLAAALMLPLMIIDHGATEVLYYLGASLSGLGTSFAMATLALSLTRKPPFFSAIAICVSSLAGLVLCGGAVILLVPWAARLLTTLTPLALYFGLRRGTLSNVEADTTRASFPDEAPANPVSSPVSSSPRLSAPAFLAFLLVIGLSLGVIMATALASLVPQVAHFTFITVTLVVTLIMLMLLCLVREQSMKMLFAAAIMVITGSFMALIVLPGVPLASAVLHYAGFAWCTILAWYFSCLLAHQHNDASFAVAGIAAYQVGQAISCLFGNTVASHLQESQTAAFVSVGMIYLVLIVALVFFFRSESSHPSLGESDPSETSEQAATLLAQNVAWETLTPREQEIAQLIARGYDRKLIAETIVVSQETVKTHTKHIYQKLDVHSRRELIALLNREN